MCCKTIKALKKSAFVCGSDGNVRWLIFEILNIDFNYSKEVNIDDVWRQAYSIYKQNIKGSDGKLTAEEIKENEEENRKYYASPQEEEILASHFAIGTPKVDPFYTASDLLKEITLLGHNSNKINNIGIGKACRKLNFVQDSKRVGGGNPVKGYYLKRID